MSKAMRQSSKGARDRPIDARIAELYETLPPSERRLADAVLECQGDLAAYSATELADRAGTSKAAAARFFRRLGYAGFRDARFEARQGRLWGSPLHAAAEGERASAHSSNLASHFARDLQNLTRTAQSLRPSDVDAAAAILAAQPRLWIVGFRNSHALAAYARGVLSTIRPDVHLVPSVGSDLAEDLAGMFPGDGMLAIGFRRRPRALHQVLRIARERNVRVALLTDLTASFPPRFATAVLKCHSWGSSLFDSYAAAMSVLNFLCGEVARRLGAKARDQLAHVETLHARLDDLAPITRESEVLLDGPTPVAPAAPPARARNPALSGASRKARS